MFEKPDGYALIKKDLTSKMDLSSCVFDGNYAISQSAEYNRLGNICDMLLFVLDLNNSDYKYETVLPSHIIDFLSKLASFLPFRNNWIVFIKKILNKNGTKNFFVFKSPKEHFDTLEETLFYGYYFRVPKNAEFYLKHIYGEDWKTPKNWIKDKSINKWQEFRNIERKES